MSVSFRTIIYARYSTDLQNPKSVEDQIDLCRREVEAKGWTVVGVHSDERISGSRDDRPGYQSLIADVRAERCDIVIAESLDRLSRDPEHTAHFYELATHYEVEILTLQEGTIDAIRLGFNSTMAAAYLSNVAFKTRRGLAGKVLRGLSAGGRAFGYKSVPGEENKGKQAIVEDEAIIVRRIFWEYARGKSPLKIATDLNAEGIAPPMHKKNKVGHWKQNTINGNRERGTGILNNELYIGRRVWNRSRYSVDPITGQKISRLNDPSKWAVAEVPDLRIVDQGLWDKVKERQGAISTTRSKRTATDKNGLSSSQGARRRKYLLSGMLECGCCGGKLTVAGSGASKYYYCANNKEKGPSVCEGMPGLRQRDAEELLLAGLRRELMKDAAFARFRDSYITEIKARSGQVSDELRLLDKQIIKKEIEERGYIMAVAQGVVNESLVAGLNAVDAQLKELRKERAATATMPVVPPEDLPKNVAWLCG